MNEASDSSKIVNLSQRMDPSSERVGELLATVRNTANRLLQQWLGHLFEHVDDALFDLAEKAENNAAQMHYFDGMRDVRKRRTAVERSFLGTIGRELGELASRRPTAAYPSAPTGVVELSLVADNELEESLAITSMIGKNESRLSRDLFAVNQRLSVICGGHKIDDGNNPVAPAILSQTFRTALHELSADMRVKLIIYKLFDRYVLSALEELYQEVNNELIRAGVLPQLRHRVARQPSNAGVDSPVAEDQQQGFLANEESGEIPSDLLQTLNTLFSARRGHHGEAGTAGTVGTAGFSGGPLPSVNELLGALSVLQSQIATTDAPPPATERQDTALNHEVTALKEQLLRQIGALRGARPGQVATIDEDTIDLVGMLFEFILEDRNLPSEMQVLLARLQIPYLKAAIIDRKLFAHRQHPARRLLDGLAEQAKGWSDESDRDRRLHGKVKSIVEQLLHEFDDDMGIFDRLLADLQQFQELSRKRADLAELRVAESTRGREKLEYARRRAAREIVDRIGTQELPPLLHGVLVRAWANHMVLLLLRHGEDSTEFKVSLHFVNDFIASSRPAPTIEARQRLRQMLPGIERALRHGLANVAFQEQDIERLLGQLHTYYRQQLGEISTPAAPAAADETALPIPDSIQPIQTASDFDDDNLGPATLDIAPDSPEWRQVEMLQSGTWLEFSLTDDAMTRAKLSWISPMTGRYLFVNRRGLKVADYAPRELAALLKQGKARVLAANALFERAMSAIVDRLSHPSPGAGKE